MIRKRRYMPIRNETVTWTRETFLRIKPRRRFIWINAHTMERMADAVASNGGPAVIFQNERDGPWAAVGIFDFVDTMKTGVIWTVQSRAMYRNLGYLNRECLDCLHYYGTHLNYDVLKCQVRLSWQTSRRWVEGFGFEAVGEIQVPTIPEPLVEYEWRPKNHGC
jgi:hypothetical protein